MRKLAKLTLAIIVVITMVFVLTACGNGDTEPELTPEPISEATPEPVVEPEPEPELEPEEDLEQEEEIDKFHLSGTWNGNVFSSEYLGFQLTVPSEWRVDSFGEMYNFNVNDLPEILDEMTEAMLAAGAIHLEDLLEEYFAFNEVSAMSPDTSGLYGISIHFFSKQLSTIEISPEEYNERWIGGIKFMVNRQELIDPNIDMLELVRNPPQLVGEVVILEKEQIGNFNWDVAAFSFVDDQARHNPQQFFFIFTTFDAENEMFITLRIGTTSYETIESIIESISLYP